ncbi:hypothetical protein ACXH30_003272 [Enterobacter cloacae]
MAEQKVKLTELPAATDTIDTAQLLVNQNETDQKLPVTHFLRAKNNLSELTNTGQARANLNVPSVDEVNDKLSGFISGGYSFTTGGSLVSRKDFIWDEDTKSWYYWSGPLPKDVPAASSPDSTGGIGVNAWSPLSDSALRSDLATGGKATLIGYNSETVQTALNRHDTDFSRIVSLDERTTVPPNEYSGNKHWMPIFEEGYQLTNYEFKTPVHVDFQFSSDPLNVATGPLFTFGRDDLSGAAAFFSQDSYEISNVTVDGGSGEFAVFQPWTSHMATISHNRIINPGVGNKWALNFKAQNWWPHVIGNTLMEYNGSASNFIKAIDDGGSSSDRYSANSRLLIANNRCAWQGGASGAGIMSYTSGAGVRIKDNSAQNAKVCCILGFPSTFTSIDGLYAEMNFGNQSAVQVGDSGAITQQIITDVLIRDLYVNLHSDNTNRIIIPGSDNVIYNDLEVDRVFVSNIPTSGFIQPIVTVPDTDYHKIIAGRISADNMPLIPLNSKNIVVFDKYGCAIPSLNGDLIYSNPTTSVPANTQTAVAPGWFAKCTSATTFAKSGSSNPNSSLRLSRNIGQIDISSGQTGSITFEHVRADALYGGVVTFQFLVNYNTPQNAVINIEVVNDDGTRTALYSGNQSIGGGWKEITRTVSVDGSNKVNSFIAVSVEVTPTSSGTLFVTGHRKNKGRFGLCHSANEFSFGDVNDLKDRYIFITP